MGLDISDENKERSVRWSYSGFDRFRDKLAKQVGIDLSYMEEYGGFVSWEFIVDPIAILLNHSDSDGDIYSSDCAKVFPRLMELVSVWSNSDLDKISAIALASIMENCARKGTKLIFV